MQKLKQQQLFDRVFEKLPDHITLLLIIISGFLLARLTWMMFPADPSIAAPLAQQPESQGVSVIQAHAKTADILGNEIASSHMMGVYKPPQPARKAAPNPVQKAKAPTPKPKARPPMSLIGVYALGTKEGIAVIDVKGQQQVIGLGEKISDTGAVLSKVYADKVDITWDDDKSSDTLTMPNIDKSALGAIQIPPGQQLQPEPVPQQVQPPAAIPAAGLNPDSNDAKPTPRAPLPEQDQNQNGAGQTSNGAGGNNVANANRRFGRNQQNGVNSNGNFAAAGKNRASGDNTNTGSNQQTVSLGDFRQQVMNNNINLLKVVRPSPARRNGQQIGFRIRPGTNRALFKQTGLKSGDIVTAINGMPLTNNASSMQAMQGLTGSSGATLNVLRGGQETTVQVSF